MRRSTDDCRNDHSLDDGKVPFGAALALLDDLLGRRAVKRIPIYDATAPIVCTIEAADVASRIELLERLRAHTSDVIRTEHGLLLRFPARPEVERDVRTFAIDEKQCCQFWGFAVDDATPGVVSLRWDGPPAAAEVVDRLHTWLLGNEPLTELSGLL